MENNIGELTKFLRGAIITMLYNSVIKRGLKMSNEEKTTLQMILSAAIQEFLEKGFTSASLQATMELSVERNWGKGRLLLKNQESGEICSVPLENGDTEIGLDTGKYQVFLIGKWFGGNLTLKSDDILFYAE